MSITMVKATTEATKVSALIIDVNDGGAIGAEDMAFSDLYLGSGGIIDFNGGDVTITHAASALTIAGGDVTIAEDLIVSGVGPHAIGGAISSKQQLTITGIFSPASGTACALFLDTTINATPDSNIFGTRLKCTINEAASGTHIHLNTLQVHAPNIVAGGASVTTASTVRIVAAPTEGTNNYALLVDDGAVRIDDTLAVIGTITGPSGTWDSVGMDIASGDSYAIASTNVLTATILGTGVLTSSLTTVGALSSGSITSSFGAIDIGTSSITSGAITSTGTSLFSKIGVGNALTDGEVHIHTASAGSIAANTVCDDLVVENSGQGGITILTPDNQSARLVFGSPTGGNLAATILYRQNINVLALGVTSTSGSITLTPGVTSGYVQMRGGFFMKERSSAMADQAGYGQLWIKIATPNEVWFTDDAGTDHQIAFV